MVAAPNDLLAAVAADYGRAREWVKENVTRYAFDGGVDIRFVAVGNEPFLRAYNGSFDRVTDSPCRRCGTSSARSTRPATAAGSRRRSP